MFHHPRIVWPGRNHAAYAGAAFTPGSPPPPASWPLSIPSPVEDQEYVIAPPSSGTIVTTIKITFASFTGDPILKLRVQNGAAILSSDLNPAGAVYAGSASPPGADSATFASLSGGTYYLQMQYNQTNDFTSFLMDNAMAVIQSVSRSSVGDIDPNGAVWHLDDALGSFTSLVIEDLTSTI